MRMFAACIAGVAAAAFCGSAQCAPGSLSYSRPTTYVDGSTLPVEEIASYNVRCSSFTPTDSPTAQACPTISPTTLAGSATGATITLSIPGSGGAACFQVQTVATSGQTSDWSTEGCKTFPPVAPNPPANVTVAVVIGINVTPVYSMTGGISRSTFVGFADLGVPCADAVAYSWRGHQFREIARDSVYWWTFTDSRVVAPCAAAG